MFTYVCGCFCWKMAALNTCSRGQIFYRAYSIYYLAIHRKGLLPSGLKTKGQGEETIEIILLGGERWLPQANTLTLERVGLESSLSEQATSLTSRCTSHAPLPAGQIFLCEHLCFISRPSLPRASPSAPASSTSPLERWREEVLGDEQLESLWSVKCWGWGVACASGSCLRGQVDDCFYFLFWSVSGDAALRSGVPNMWVSWLAVGQLSYPCASWIV